MAQTARRHGLPRTVFRCRVGLSIILRQALADRKRPLTVIPVDSTCDPGGGGYRPNHGHMLVGFNEFAIVISRVVIGHYVPSIYAEVGDDTAITIRNGHNHVFEGIEA